MELVASKRLCKMDFRRHLRFDCRMIPAHLMPSLHKLHLCMSNTEGIPPQHMALEVLGRDHPPLASPRYSAQDCSVRVWQMGTGGAASCGFREGLG